MHSLAMLRTPPDGCVHFRCGQQSSIQHAAPSPTISTASSNAHVSTSQTVASMMRDIQATIVKDFEHILADARDQFCQHQELFKNQALLVQKMLDHLPHKDATVASNGHCCENFHAVCTRRLPRDDDAICGEVKSKHDQARSWANEVGNLPLPPESYRKNGSEQGSTTNRSIDLYTSETSNAASTEAVTGLRRSGSLTSLTMSSSPSRKLMSSIDGEKPPSDCRAMQCLSSLINNELFEATFACLIALNAIVLGIEAQYFGIGYGHEIGFPEYRRPKEDAWPWAETTFGILALGFGLAFTMEVLLKMIVFRFGFFLSWWNWFDTFIVGLWVLEAMIGGGFLPLNPMILRLVRVIRLLRLIRLAKTVQLFDNLRLLMGSLEASWRVCFWSFTFLFFLMTICALVLHYTLEPYIMAESNSEADRHELFVYFGTFSRSMLSMFELTLGNWVPLTRLLHEKVTEWFCPVLLIYNAVVAFAVITVIRGIFLHETFQVAAGDDELMIMKKERQIKKDILKFHQLFVEADTSGDGELSKDEFEHLMCDARVKTWLAAMDVEVQDPTLLFWLMDINEDQSISAEEFVRGFGRLRGPSRSMDMITLLHHFQLLQASRH